MRDAPLFGVPPLNDDADIHDVYVGSVGPLRLEIADGAADVDVHTRSTGMVDVVIWSEDAVDGSRSVFEAVQLTPSDARCLAALLLKAAGPRPGHAGSVLN